MNKIILNLLSNGNGLKRIEKRGNLVIRILLSLITLICIEAFANEKQNEKRIMSDTMINTWTANDQLNPKISSLSDGNFVVIWESNLQDGTGWDIHGQIFYSNGIKKGKEFCVNDYLKPSGASPDIASTTSDKFMVVWVDYCNDFFSCGLIIGQIFINNGTKVGDQFQISSNTGFSRYFNNPSVTTLKNNNFIVVWDYEFGRIYIQIVTDIGTTVGTSISINIPGNTPGNSPSSPLVTSLANGNFVVVWHYNNGQYDIYAQIFYNNGSTLGVQFLVNTYTTSNQQNPSVISASNSDFTIVWESQGQESSYFGIYGQIFTSSGSKKGNELRISTYIISNQNNPSIALLMNDNYVVTWQSDSQDGNGYGVYGQILDSSGIRIGNEFKMNSYTNSNQQNPTVSPLINTNFVVVWMSNGQDGNGNGIFGNIYQSSGNLTISIGFNTCPLNCQSCDNSTNCLVCNPNFQLQSNGLCGCFNGFYLDNLSTFCMSK